MNRVCLVGRLTRDPELRSTANGTAVCNFTLAVDRRFKSDNQPTADFINVIAWSGTANFVGEWFRKGMRVYVDGRIQTRNWEDKEGKKRFATEVVAEQVGFADGRQEKTESPTTARAEEIDDDDLPF